jgi:hypothetical protein
MESVGLFLNAENVRTLVLLVAIVCGIVWQRNGMSKLEIKMLEMKMDILKEIKGEMKEEFETFHAQLKSNDFKHLNDTIEELTFMLEKNGYLSPEDKKHIDGRLDK